LTSGRRERRRLRTRRALLDAALELFSRRGIYATRLEDVTDRADLGKGAFYNYFAAKDQLIAELLSEAVDLLDRRYLEGLDPRGSMGRRVAEIARRHQKFFDRHPGYLLVFHQARGLAQIEPGAARRLSVVFLDYLSRLSRRLFPPEARVEGSEKDRLDVAAAVAGAISGYLTFKTATRTARRPETVERLLAAGIPGLVGRRKRRRAGG
jgi:AcrR family transcriptional regulator